MPDTRESGKDVESVVIVADFRRDSSYGIKEGGYWCTDRMVFCWVFGWAWLTEWVVHFIVIRPDEKRIEWLLLRLVKSSKVSVSINNCLFDGG